MIGEHSRSQPKVDLTSDIYARPSGSMERSAPAAERRIRPDSGAPKNVAVSAAPSKISGKAVATAIIVVVVGLALWVSRRLLQRLRAVVAEAGNALVQRLGHPLAQGDGRGEVVDPDRDAERTEQDLPSPSDPPAGTAVTGPQGTQEAQEPPGPADQWKWLLGDAGVPRNTEGVRDRPSGAGSQVVLFDRDASNTVDFRSTARIQWADQGLNCMAVGLSEEGTTCEVSASDAKLFPIAGQEALITILLKGMIVPLPCRVTGWTHAGRNIQIHVQFHDLPSDQAVLIRSALRAPEDYGQAHDRTGSTTPTSETRTVTQGEA